MRKNTFDKVVSAAASLALVVGLMPAAAFAEAGEGAAAAQLAGDGGAATLQDAASGTWGDLTWTYDAATKTVTISGSGELTGGAYDNPGWKTAGLDAIAFEKVVLSKGITSIGSNAFYGCEALSSIDLSGCASLTSIGDYAFNNCKSLVSVALPSSLASIGKSAFRNCASLSSVSIPSSVTSIGDQAFYDCYGLASVTFAKDSQLQSISYATFSGCKSLTSIDIPSSVTTIGTYAFECCSSLVSVNIPSSVTTIGQYAFYSCTSLASVELPKSVDCSTIGAHAFINLANPSTITVQTEDQFKALDGNSSVMTLSHTTVLLKSAKAQRLAGDNAYGTMTQIVGTGWEDESCDTVILATFDGYWDALAASGLAGICECPVLLTDTDSLSADAKSEIERLGAETVVIVGGTAAVSSAVEDQVKQLDCETVRCAGSNAVATAVEIYRTAVDISAWGDTCIVATVNGYYDALSASPYAYAKRAPIFLANSDGTISADVVAAIKAYGFTRVVIAGGTSCVTNDAASALASETGASIDRRAGDNCFSTSVELAKLCLEDGMTMARTYFATGLGGYWDALTGAALAGKYGSPLLLVDDGYENAIDFVSANKAHVAQPYIFGGTAAVSSTTEDKITAALQ